VRNGCPNAYPGSETGRTEKLERKRAYGNHNTTKTKRCEEDTTYDKGEACAAFPATAAGRFDGDLGLWVFFWDTCEAFAGCLAFFFAFRTPHHAEAT
jgi:hypothetical protein